PFHPTRRTGTIGVPFPSTEMRVVDPDNPEQDVPQGERGELLIKGPQVFQGYWNLPEETEAVILPDGWLRTGDLVTLDEDGLSPTVDRVKATLPAVAFNVVPTAVEAVLRTHEDIEDAAVVGVPRESGGDRVMAAVIARDGATVDVDEVGKWLRERLVAYKVPRKITIVDELPKSMLGKVLRKEVRTQLTAAENRD